MYQFKKMYDKNEMCDFTIKSSDEKEYHVHKSMICAMIPYFRSFKDFTNNCSENSVTFELFSSETIELIINYVYNGKIEYNKDTVFNVVNAADYLQMESLKIKAMEKLFNIGDKNTLFDKKVVLCIKSSVAKCIEAQKFYGENFFEFSEKESFYLLGIESLISILDKDYLNVPSEEFVFNSAMKWINHDYQNRKQYILNVFSILRIAYLDYSVIFDKILTEPTIINIDDVRDKINKYLRSCSEESFENKYLKKFLPERNSYKFKCLIYNDSNSNSAISIEIRNYDQKYGEWLLHSCALFKSTYRVLGIKYGNKVYFSQYFYTERYSSGVILDMDNHSTQKVSFSDSRYGRVMTQFEDKIFSIGGINDVKKKPIPNGVTYAASVVFNNKIYIIGGKLNEALSTVKKYSICRNVWEDIHPMNYPRWNASAIVYNNRIFVIGGYSFNSELKNCEVYDIEQELWSDIPEMPYKRAGASLSIKNDILYVVGGVGEEPNKIMKYNLLQSTWREGPLLNCLNSKYVAL
uniref:BTB domain-containing protein n=1 Tax=Strongyloides stercoralis TaxID=6248 RepID=A0AAF5HZ57_STRER